MTGAPSDTALALLALAPRRPAVLSQAMADAHCLSRSEAREVLRELLDRGLMTLGWDGLLRERS